MATLVQQLINSLGIAAVLALIGIGISLIFGTSGIINFAQADFSMLGAYVALGVASAGYGLVVGTVVAMLTMAVLGAVVYLLLFRWVVGRTINGFILSVALSILLHNGAEMIWGGVPKSYGPVLSGVWRIGNVTVRQGDAVVLGCALVVLLLIFVLIFRTALGRALRACLDDPSAATLVGIKRTRIELYVFMIAMGAGGVAGGLLLIEYPASPYLGANFLIMAFAAALLAGLRRPQSILLGALVLGLIDSLSVQLGLASWSYFLIFTITIAALLWRPQGLFSPRT